MTEKLMPCPRDAAIHAVAMIEMDREGAPHSRNQEEFYSDAAEVVDAVLAAMITTPAADEVEAVARAIQREAQDNRNDSPVDYGDAEALAKVAIAAMQARSAEPAQDRHELPADDAEQRLRMIVSHATGGNLQYDPAMSVNAICCEITAMRNKVWKRAQEAMMGDLTQRPTEPAPQTNSFLSFWYENYRGEVSERTVRPIRIYHGATEWHPEPQWLLEAFDMEKDAVRAFAMCDMQAPPAEPAGEEPVELPTGDPDHTDCDGPDGGGRFAHPSRPATPTNPERLVADPLGVEEIDLDLMRKREVQAMGAALSTRNWHDMETAYNEIRDRVDRELGRRFRIAKASAAPLKEGEGE